MIFWEILHSLQMIFSAIFYSKWYFEIVRLLLLTPIPVLFLVSYFIPWIIFIIVSMHTLYLTWLFRAATNTIETKSNPMRAYRLVRDQGTPRSRRPANHQQCVINWMFALTKTGWDNTHVKRGQRNVHYSLQLYLSNIIASPMQLLPMSQGSLGAYDACCLLEQGSHQ